MAVAKFSGKKCGRETDRRQDIPFLFSSISRVITFVVQMARYQHPQRFLRIVFFAKTHVPGSNFESENNCKGLFI